MKFAEKLVEIEARFEELNRRLQEPELAQDQKALRELGKEHHRLASIVEHHRTLVRLEKELEEARELLTTEADEELVGLARTEISALEGEVARLGDELLILLLPRDDNDEKNVLLEVRSGTGGDEAALFCGELFRAYGRFAERHNWRVEVMSSSAGPQGGFKEVVALIEGEGAFAMLKYESGVHRVQRVPQTETQGRVHTSAVTVAVLPEAEEVEVDIADNELRIDVYRSSGPGGQSVNTTDSAVRITHLPTGLVVSCQDEKSQHKNKAKGLKILRSRLLDLRQREQDEKQAEQRRSQVKSGDRSEKVRTYNFPQDRLTDHRINLTVHNLPRIMQGELDEIINSLRSHFQAALLSRGTQS